MTENGPEYWARIDELYYAALEQPEERRDAFLNAACRGDERLQGEVRSLLRFHGAEGVLDASPAEIALKLEAAIRESESGGPLPGDIISHYRIIEKLGAGGMGVVYRAEDLTLDRTVALKFLSPYAIEDPARTERLIREAKAAAALDHQNVCTVYEIGETDSGTFLAMALVDGERLSDRIAKQPLKLAEALDIGIQTSQGLQSAHAKGIVHRDIKSSNLMINRRGQVKIMDFGIAQLANQERLTQTLTIVGSPGYLSPEQAQGRKADARSDIWSLGVVLYETVTGRLPFEGGPPDALLHSIIHEAHEPVTALRAGLPVELDRILDKMLSKDPAERYQHLDDVLVDLRRLAKQHASGLLETSAKTGGRVAPRRLALWLAVSGALLLVVLTAFVFWRRPQPAASNWTGTRLVAPLGATAPRISPDGKTLAFRSVASPEDADQLTVMTLETGNWTVLTNDRTPGNVVPLDWSQDGTRIYYTRLGTPMGGVYSMPAIGGEERLIVPDAGAAQPLPDGSLLIARNGTGSLTLPQIVRYWPRDNRFQEFPAVVEAGDQLPLRVLPDGSRAVFIGELLGTGTAKLDPHLYLLEISTGTITQIPWNVSKLEAVNYWPLAVMPDGESLVTTVPNGDLHRLVAISLSPPYQVRPLLDLQHQVQGIDVGPDGSLYVDQITRPVEVVRFPDSGGEIEHLGGFSTVTIPLVSHVLHLPDDRTLAMGLVNGRHRLLVSAPGKEPVPFIETDEETWTPAILLGKDRLAFLIGNAGDQRIGIAALESGRILGSVPGIKVKSLFLFASPDGETLFYADPLNDPSHSIWSIPVAGGEPRAISNGVGVTMYPDGKNLLVTNYEPNGVGFKKVSVENGKTQQLTYRDQVRFAPLGAILNPRAIGRDGRILVLLDVNNGWRPGIFDPRNGTIRAIPIPFIGNIFYPAWTDDGRVIGAVWGWQSSMWRYKPTMP
jgi:serine/threonine protein kinase